MPIALIVQLIIAILSAIPYLVQAAEALHDRGAGTQKKAFVLDAIQRIVAIAKVSDGKIARALTPETEGALMQQVSTAVDAAVAVMNASGGKPTNAPAA